MYTLNVRNRFDLPELIKYVMKYDRLCTEHSSDFNGTQDTKYNTKQSEILDMMSDQNENHNQIFSRISMKM